MVTDDFFVAKTESKTRRAFAERTPLPRPDVICNVAQSSIFVDPLGALDPIKNALGLSLGQVTPFHQV